MLSQHLSRKATLGVAQLLLALCGTVLIFYVPIAFACRGTTSIAFITVSAKYNNDSTVQQIVVDRDNHVPGMRLSVERARVPRDRVRP